MSKTRILLVDDNPEFLETLARFLADDPSLEVVGRAFSGRDAIEHVARLHPDIVLMDIGMPGVDGLEATWQIKLSPIAPVVILMMHHDWEGYRAHTLAVGADWFLPKPEIGTQLLPLLHGLSSPPLRESEGGAPPIPQCRWTAGNG